jgi:alanyl-tRNA synthetase
MTHSQIREKFLKFFESRGHKIVPSSSLLPTDPSVLFTTAGMQPMIPYLLGKVHPAGKRVANSQKCFRAQDIEEVGDNRHTTFFEMLGNWSFGDYFKKEQLNWIFNFLINEIKINPQNLYVTVFSGNDQIPRDTESVQIWKELFKKVGIEAVDLENSEQEGVRDGRIFYYGDKKNWWSLSGTPEEMAVEQPGGPDSEMFYDFGDTGQHDPKIYGRVCHVNCDCGRFLEIGNNVFMEYQKENDGSFKLLPQKNIDFGGGLERMTAASQNQPDIFLTDSFWSIIEKLEEISNKKYEGDTKRNFRIIADHIKAAIILIADGATPSNKLQGYIVRRLIRRAMRYARLLDEQKIVPLFMAAGDAVISMYSNLDRDGNTIMRVLLDEVGRFSKTLNAGLKEIAKIEELNAKNAFNLYETFGYPFEMIEEIARERGQKVEYGEFRKEFEKHQEISRAGAEKKFGGHGMKEGDLTAGDAEEMKKKTRLHTATHVVVAALEKVLGQKLPQTGSDITAERLRFDFNFPRKMTLEELKKAEDMSNDVVAKDLPVTFEEVDVEEAFKSGATGAFKHKYSNRVKVYSIGQPGSYFSRELCGGPHVSHTGEIGHIKIVKEESVSGGNRRIRATVE